MRSFADVELKCTSSERSNSFAVVETTVFQRRRTGVYLSIAFRYRDVNSSTVTVVGRLEKMRRFRKSGASRSRKELTRLVSGEVRRTSGEFSLIRELGILLMDAAVTNSTCFKDPVSVRAVAWESYGVVCQRPSQVGHCSESTRFWGYKTHLWLMKSG